MKKAILTFISLILVLGGILSSSSPKRVYGIVPAVNIRKAPSLSAQVIYKVRHGRWLTVILKRLV